jgi:hypothetical protein
MLSLGTAAFVQAQIRYVTVPTIKLPYPPMQMFQITPGTVATNAPVPAPAPAATQVQVAAPVRLSADKAELDRRVVVFQKQRAEEGFPSAQYELGVRYLKGDGVEKDAMAARKWLSRAAKQGDAQAQRKLDELDRK